MNKVTKVINKPMNYFADQKGKLGWIVLWALGVPIPVLLILYVLRGCT